MEVINHQSKQVLENVLGMKGGDGDSSYAKNSANQLIVVESVKPIMEQGIHEKVGLMTNVGGTFRIGDFGCGSGKNTLVVVDTIVNAVQRSLKGQEMPEFEVYFIDLPSNDFNSIFRMLPTHNQEYINVDNNPLAGRSYIAAAVCGSYFKRLLPRKSLHFGHSSHSLHWLSRVPESVEQRRSPRVYVSGDCDETVAAAYLQQFDVDLTAFLKGRGEEIVDGGCMFICLSGRKAGKHIMEDQGILGYVARDIETALLELVNEGVIEKEKLESFNIPYFGPSLEEVESIVKREGSFAIDIIKNVGGIPGYSMAHLNKGEENMFGRLVANNYKAIFESMVEAHFGSTILMEEIFITIGKRASNLVKEYLSRDIELVVAFLIKKGEKNMTIS